MAKFDTHLCLVSAQSTPNLIPVLDAAFSPRRVVMAVSPDMQDRGKWLMAVMRRHRLLVEKLTLENAYDFNSCWDVFSDWVTAQTTDVALNVTGGTKVMAMAAQDVFREMEKPIFYINVENDTVLRLDRGEQPFALASKIKLSEYLESHGYKVNGADHHPNITAEKRDFVNRLACESKRLGNGLGQLNYLAQLAKGSLISPELDANQRDSRALDELISMFSLTGWLTDNKNKLEFPNETARQFVNGGWLEFLVYQTLAQLAPEIGLADYAIGLEVSAADGKTKNELDVAFLYKNTLHIIECKSANLIGNGKMEQTAGTEALYKLDTLRSLGGLRTKCLLVDFRGGLRDVDKGRAAQMNVGIISGEQLKNLKGALKSWLK